MSEEERLMAIDRLEEQMLAAAGNLGYEGRQAARPDAGPARRKAAGYQRKIPFDAQEAQK